MYFPVHTARGSRPQLRRSAAAPAAGPAAAGGNGAERRGAYCARPPLLQHRCILDTLDELQPKIPGMTRKAALARLSNV